MKQLLLLFLLISSAPILAQTISGPTSVYAGATNPYSFNDQITLTSPQWSASNGSASGSSSGTNYTCNATWNTAGTQTLALYDGATLIAELEVEVVECAPSTPSTAFTYSSSTTNVTISRSSNPPSGVTWFWQTSA